MPNLSNISSFGGSTLDIRNLDVVDLAADNISCDTFTVNSSLIVNGIETQFDTLQVDTILPATGTHLDITSSTVDLNGALTVSSDLFVNGNVAVTDTGLGINTLVPGFALHVIGNSYITQGMDVGNGLLQVNYTNSAVGIGTFSAPTEALEVEGNIVASGVSIGTFSTPTEALDIDGNIIATGTITGSSLDGTLTTAAQPNITSVGSLTSLTVTGDVAIDSNTIKVDSTNNRVGINKTTPTVALDVVGNCNISGALSFGSIGFDANTPPSGTLTNTGNLTVTGTLTVDTFSVRPTVGGAVTVTGATVTFPVTGYRNYHIMVKDVQTTTTTLPRFTVSMSSGTATYTGDTYSIAASQTNTAWTTLIPIQIGGWASTSVINANIHFQQMTSTTWQVYGTGSRNDAGNTNGYLYQGTVTTTVANSITGVLLLAGAGTFSAGTSNYTKSS